MERNLHKIVAETERYRITGMLRLPNEGYGSRLSDYLNAPERSFVPLTDVELVPIAGDGSAERLNFLAVSLRHIVFATQIDEEPAQ